MSIGIVVYSQTGNTLSVARELRDRLDEQGKAAIIERIATEGDPKQGTVKISGFLDLSGYDALVFAAPVQAFNLAPAMKAYLGEMPEASAAATACFVTQHFKQPWMGGNNALRAMKKALAEKGLSAGETGVVNWSRADREQQIDKLVEKLCAFLKNA